MLFWFIAALRYLLVACASFLMSIAISFLIMVFFAQDDSPWLGVLWYMVFVATATLLIPLSLGATAELIQRKLLSRQFQWSKALARSLASVPIAIGPFYPATSVFPHIEDQRPTHWVGKEILFYSLSVVFAYFALRIRRPSVSTDS